jgi:adenosylcobyric acid synthase
MVLLEPEERALVKAFIINKFRGETNLLGDGLRMLQERAFDTPTLGVIPFLPNIGIAAEDSVALDGAERRGFVLPIGGLRLRLSPKGGEEQRNGLWPKLAEGRAEMLPLDLVVIRLPCISNFDDFDPLAAEPGVHVRFVERLHDLGQPAAVILPGSKMTLADLGWLHQTGLAEQIVSLAKTGMPVVGICGGYQMLGQSLFDPEGVEAEAGTYAPGLGLLAIETIFAGDKRTVQVQATLQADIGPFADLQGAPIHGYEIHMGRSQPLDPATASLCRVGRSTHWHADGTLSEAGRIWGTYLHGLFENDALRHAWLRSLGWQGSGQLFDRELAYNRLAEHVRSHLDMAALQRIIWG